MLNIKTTANTLGSADADPDDEYTGFARDLVDLIRTLAVGLDPIYVSTFNTHVEPNTPSPETVLPFDIPIVLERIPWLGVYSEPMIEQFGGREHVLETPAWSVPAWSVEELANGSILIITTRTPWEGCQSITSIHLPSGTSQPQGLSIVPWNVGDKVHSGFSDQINPAWLTVHTVHSTTRRHGIS